MVGGWWAVGSGLALEMGVGWLWAVGLGVCGLWAAE